MDLFTYPQQPGFKAPGTSAEAATAIAGSTAAARQAILDLLNDMGPMSADQISDHFGWRITYGRPRVSELKTMGLVDKAGTTRNDTGKNANLWRVI